MTGESAFFDRIAKRMGRSRPTTAPERDDATREAVGSDPVFAPAELLDQFVAEA